MSSGQQLSERHAQLVMRCAAERARAAAAIGSIKEQIAAADRGLEAARRWIRNPFVIAAGIALALVIGQSRRLQGAGAVLALLTTGLKARGLARFVRDRQARRAPGA